MSAKQFAAARCALAGALALGLTCVTSHADAAKARRLAAILVEPSATPSITPPHVNSSARFFTINQILAKRAALDQPQAPTHFAALGTGTVTDTAPSTDRPASSREPFGLFGFRAPEGQLWAKWRSAEAEIKHDVAVMAQCRADPDHCGSRAAERFNALIDEARKRSGRERLASVNRAVNDAIRYTTDLQQYGVIDVWSAPLSTFTTGRGDCEDYAIAKYVALKEAGVAEDDLRLLLVRDQSVHEDHAVVAARQDGHWLILDNRHMLLPTDSELWNFSPLFSIDQTGVKLLAAPYLARVTHGNDERVSATNGAATSSARPETSGDDGFGTGNLPLVL